MKFFIINTSGAWGGIESHTIILAKALIGMGHEVLVGCRPGSRTHQNAVDNNLTIVPLAVTNALDIGFVRKTADIIRREHVDVVAANLGKEYWPVTVAGKLGGAKVVLFRHQLDPVKRITVWLMTHYVDKVIAVTAAVQQVLVRSGVPDNKSAVIYPGQEVEKFRQAVPLRQAVRQELAIGKEEIVVSSAGKIHYGKGSLDLLSSFASLAAAYGNLKLMYIGDGEQRAAVEEEAGRLGLSHRVICTGFRHDIERYMAAVDIFVLASKTYESFGMVLIEAMATGRPVIGSRLGGIPEVIEHGTNGILVEPGDVDDLARTIKLLVDEPALRGRLAAAASRTIDERFTAAASARTFVEVVQSC